VINVFRPKFASVCLAIVFSCVQIVSGSDISPPLSRVSSKDMLVVIPHACQKKIEAHKAKITSMMTRDWRIRTLFQSAMIASTGYVAYKTLQSFFGNSLPPMPAGYAKSQSVFCVL